MTSEPLAAAWIPPGADLTLEAAAEVAMRWADEQAAARGAQAMLVTDLKGEYRGEAPFDRYADGRHITPRSSGLAITPGAVIAHNPTAEALELAMDTARGTAIAVVALLPGPWWLHGWAAAVGAQDLLTGETAALDAALVEPLTQIVAYGNNGFAAGYGRDNAQDLLRQLQRDGLLEHDLVVSALGGLGLPARHQHTISKMIDKMVPAGTGRDRRRS
jgi:uncharacterized protein (UPF0297 family)